VDCPGDCAEEPFFLFVAAERHQKTNLSFENELMSGASGKRPVKKLI
jgi:hypothetical protein